MPLEAESPTSQDIRSARRALAVLAAAQFLIALDFSIVYVALPSIGAALSLGPTVLPWVVNAYALAFAGLLLASGRLSDLLGAQRVFGAALVIFAGSSILAGAAQHGAPLLGARAFQGLAAALLAPSTLSLLAGVFAAGPARDRALAVWGTTGALGLVLGTFSGGWLTQILSWRWVFFGPAVIALATLVSALVTLRGVAAEAQTEPRRLHPGQMLLASAAVALLVGAFTEAADSGWSAGSTLLLFPAALVSAVAFAATQRARRDGLVPRPLLRIRSLTISCAISAMFMASLGAEFYLVTLYLQESRGFGPLATGTAFLPLAGAIVIGNSLAGRWASRLGVRSLLVAAFGIGAVGLGLLATADLAGHFALGVLPGLLISGLGQGVAFTGMFIAGLRDVPTHHQGIASGLITTTQYAGGALGIAVLTLALETALPTIRYSVAFVCAAVIAALATALAAIGFRDPSLPHGSEVSGVSGRPPG